MKVHFLPPEAGTFFWPPKAHIKSLSSRQSCPRKGPKMPPCQPDFRGDGANAHNLTEQALLDGKLFDEGAFSSPRGRDDFSALKSAQQEPTRQSRPSSEGPESAAVPGRFASVSSFYSFSTSACTMRKTKPKKTLRFLPPKAGTIFSPHKRAARAQEKSRPSSERSESVAVPGRFAFVIFCAQC